MEVSKELRALQRRLDALQDAIIKDRGLWDVSEPQKIKELADDLAGREGVTFEQACALQLLRGKLAWLMERHRQRSFMSEINTLEKMLRGQVDDEAWQIYLHIEKRFFMELHGENPNLPGYIEVDTKPATGRAL